MLKCIYGSNIGKIRLKIKFFEPKNNEYRGFLSRFLSYYYLCVRKGFFLDMKKYLTIALSLLVVLLGAVACEKQGGEEEGLPGASAKAYTCTDNENGITWKISFINKSLCEILAKTSKSSLKKTNGYTYSGSKYIFPFTIVIPANMSSSGKVEKYLFSEGKIVEPWLVVLISRYNDDDSRGELKRYLFE